MYERAEPSNERLDQFRQRTVERVQLEIESGNIILEEYGTDIIDVDSMCEAPVKSIVDDQTRLLYELRL